MRVAVFLAALVVLAVLAAARDAWERIQLRSPSVTSPGTASPGLPVAEGVNLGGSVSSEVPVPSTSRFALVALLAICAAAVSRTGSRMLVRTNVLPGDSPSGGLLTWVWGLIGFVLAVLGSVLVTQALVPPTPEEEALSSAGAVGAFGGAGPSLVGAVSGDVYWYLSGAALVVALVLLSANSTPLRQSLAESSASGWVFTSMVAFLAVALVVVVSNPVLAASQLAAGIVSTAIIGMLVAYSVPVWVCMAAGATSFAALYYHQPSAPKQM